MRVLIIDNYDSFTYNLYQFIGEIFKTEQSNGTIDSFDITVKRNDEITIHGIKEYAPDRIIVSPGPGTPEDEAYFGVCAKAITELGKDIPLLGVCLGMQGIVHLFGGRITLAELPMHGKTSPITHTGTGVFADIPNQLEVMRYHSLIAEAKSFPDCLELTATVGSLALDQFGDIDAIRTSSDFEVMGVKHKEYPIYGIQFHPESFATEGGKEIIRNFLFGAQ
ncbi:MAG: aminodeoxychorismate/anthranilate synthase component II [Fibrobacterales bacterium]